MTKEEILQMINAYIVENNIGAITAAKLNELLSDITNIIADGGIVYKGSVYPSALPQAPQEGDTYRMSDAGTISGDVQVSTDDIITYTNGAWVLFSLGNKVVFAEVPSGVTFSYISGLMTSGKIVYIRTVNSSDKKYHLLQEVQNNQLSEPVQYGYYTINIISSPYSGKSISYTKHYISYQSNTFTTQVLSSVHVPGVINNVTSTSTTDALSANMGKELQDQISNIKARGRYLSVWNCTTGLAETSPTVDPYEYKPGDYFIVGVVGTGTKYKPSGSTYSANTPSTAVETGDVKVNDTYYYDGESWTLLDTVQIKTTFAGIVGHPTDNTALANALSNKEDINNKVVNITSEATDVEYASARAVYRMLRDQLYTRDQIIELLSQQPGKHTTLAGYGITDAYTKSQINDTIMHGNLIHIPASTTAYYDIGGEANNNSTYIFEARSSNISMHSNAIATKYTRFTIMIITTGALSISWNMNIKWRDSALTNLSANVVYVIHFEEVNGYRFADYFQSTK